MACINKLKNYPSAKEILIFHKSEDEKKKKVTH